MRGKTEAQLELHNLSGLKCATDGGRAHKKLRGRDTAKVVGKNDNSSGLEPRWCVHSGTMAKRKKKLKIEEIRLKKIVKEELVNYPEELQIPGILRLFFCKFRQVFF